MEKQENRPGTAQQCESLGDVFMKLEEFDQAEDYLMRASDLYEAMKEVGSVKEVQNKLMLIFSQPKYLKNRKQQIREALKKPEAEKDSKLKLALLSDLGNVLFMANEWDEGCDLAKEAIAMHEKSGDKAALSAALGNLGSIYMQKQNYAESEENYARAIELKQEYNAQKGLQEK